MQFKEGLLAPSIAVLTVVAIMATGFVLGEVRGGVPTVGLLGSAQQLASAAEPVGTPAQMDEVAVADRAPEGYGAGTWQQSSSHAPQAGGQADGAIRAADDPAGAGSSDDSGQSRSDTSTDTGESEDAAENDSTPETPPVEVAGVDPNPVAGGSADSSGSRGVVTASAGSPGVVARNDGAQIPAARSRVAAVATSVDDEHAVTISLEEEDDDDTESSELSEVHEED